MIEFPRNNCGLFYDPLSWNIKNASLGYNLITHKGHRGFGGKIRCLGNNTYVFFAHNVEFFCEDDFSHDAHTALNVIDEVSERLFNRYADIISNFEILKGKTIQIMYLPLHYAEKKAIGGLSRDISTRIVCSEEYIDTDTIIIRYSVDIKKLMSAIEVAHDRHVENSFLKELLTPLHKYSPTQYKLLIDALDKDTHLKKTVGVFHIEQDYYFSSASLDTEISTLSYTRVRKEIAKICLESEINPGEYYGRNATKIIRRMQASVVGLFEKYISNYDKEDLHNKALNYYAFQLNGINLNRKRYTSFDELDEEILPEFEQKTRKIREEYKRFSETALYLIESNLSVIDRNDNKMCSKVEFEFLLAFADWLVTLQENADICFYSDSDLKILIDDEYRVNIIYDDEILKEYDSILLRKYNSRNYVIKQDEEDKKFMDQAIEAFKEDTGIDLPLLITFMDYMQLEITESTNTHEIYPNVFDIETRILIESFNSILHEPVEEIDIINIIDFLTINPQFLKVLNGEQQDILPIWEREKRSNRFNVKPIVRYNDKCIFSPVAMENVHSLWKYGITDWYPPYEIGLDKLSNVLACWKKRYEDMMVFDIVEIFKSQQFDLVVSDVDLNKRFPQDGYPEELGDYDILAINKTKHEIWVIESKVLHKVGSVFEDQMLQKGFFKQGKYDEKFQRRINYMQNNKEKILESFHVDAGEYKIIPYMVTNKLFTSRYKKLAFPIITFFELQQILDENYATNDEETP